jgi:putative membrane protein
MDPRPPQPQPSATPGWLLAAFVCIWAALAVGPWYRADWLLENVIVFVALPLFVRSARAWRFSDAAYVCLFVFLVLHSVGAHYTYSEVPYDDWFRALSGRSLNDLLGWERNHYDRLVHFSYGLLLLPASVELFDRVAPPRGLWRALLPVLFIMSHSVIYEQIEWGAALLFGGDLGQAYLGTQGDVWDAQKDTALATLGAMTSMAVLRLRAARTPAGPPSR